jgi:hypothetical protein
MSIQLPRTMRNRIGVLADRLRRPEYTGENRCTPCTVVNVLIGAAVSVLAGVLWLPAGVLVAAGSAGAIYLRGYLVPYTPQFTKRHFPDRVLRWFEKAPAGEVDLDADEIDVEQRLRALGAVTERDDSTDLRLEPSFREALRREIRSIRETAVDRADGIAELFDLDPDEHDCAVESYGSGSTALVVDDRHVAQWASEAAFVADLAADRVLRERREEWADLPVIHRSELLGSIRLFVEQCPSCDAPVSLIEETVESCCREREVAAVTCDDCSARLFETGLPDHLQAG